MPSRPVPEISGGKGQGSFCAGVPEGDADQNLLTKGVVVMDIWF